MACYQIVKLMPESDWNVDLQISRRLHLEETLDLNSAPSERLLEASLIAIVNKDLGNSNVEEAGRVASGSVKPTIEHYAIDDIDLTKYKPLSATREDILLDACQLAYYDHHPLVFSPDLVYAYLAKGIAVHINQYPEEMRNLYVGHDGKKQLFYRNDSFVRGSKENDWSLMFKNFADQLKGETKENSVIQHDLTFSTSTKMTEAHRHVLAMESMKSYFEYIFLCGCGTACVILEGTARDWTLLQEKVTTQLKEINEYCDSNTKAKRASLKWWSPVVKLMLANFVDTYNTQENGEEISKELKLWWNAIYKYNAGGGSGMGGPTFITGWVNIFFPYLSEGQPSKDVPNPWVKHWSPISLKPATLYKRLRNVLAEREMEGGLFGDMVEKPHPDEIRIHPDSYVSYVASVPFKWMYHEERFNMKALIGYAILARVAVAGGEYPVGTLKMFPACAVYYEPFAPTDRSLLPDCGSEVENTFSPPTVEENQDEKTINYDKRKHSKRKIKQKVSCVVV